jgi:hypothetical protein
MTAIRLLVVLPTALAGLSLLAQEHRSEEQETEDRLAEILAQPQEFPASDVLARLRPEDTAKLLRAYHRLKLPSKRDGIAIALGFAGGGGALRALTNTLTVEFAGWKLAERDSTAMLNVLTGVAVLAQENDQAFRFMKDAIALKTWQRIRRWKSTDPDRDTGMDGVFIAISIQALGLTGRPEAATLIRGLRSENYGVRSPNGQTRHFKGNLLEAAFRLSRFEKMGREAFRAQMFGPAAERSLAEWKRTPEGVDWYRWAFPPGEHPRMWKDGFPVD